MVEGLTEKEFVEYQTLATKLLGSLAKVLFGVGVCTTLNGFLPPYNLFLCVIGVVAMFFGAWFWSGEVF